MPQLTGKTYWMRTYGCQMNQRDSEALACLLEEHGATLATTEESADILVFNTCSVRDQAERKAIGKVQLLKRLKRRRPDVLIGVVGCMAQNYGAELLDRIPHLDFVLGTDQIHRLPEVLADLLIKGGTAALTETGPAVLGALQGHLPGQLVGYVPVMRGCDRFCSYCIVPYVRGREKSRLANDVVAEVRRLAEGGCREILLLGQNITAYGIAEDRRANGRWSGKSHFAELLRRVNDVDGIERIRFASPHVRYMNDEFIETVAELPAVCESIHVPLQSGSDRILKAMRRGYTVEQYRGRIDKLRSLCPEMAFSTDVIVGFPGETEADFEATRALMVDVAFDMAYIFKYSVRTGTVAARMDDDVPRQEKERRNQVLLSVLEEGAYANNRQCLGKEVQVLVEGASKRRAERWTGRSRTAKVCHFAPDGETKTGTIRTMQVTDVTASSLFGRLL